MNEDFDRLSNLPDSVLVEILSLLKAREVVQTCVLSKRWLKLWASVPCLNFDMDDFFTEEHPVIWKKDTKRFKKFGSRFLYLRENCVNTDKFVLRYVICSSRPRTKISRSAKRWILYVLNHKPKNLHIEIKSTKENLHIPESLSTCESLQEVYLSVLDRTYRFGYIIEPDRVCLPNLRAIHFSHLLIDKECMQKILHGCPILKQLSMHDCNLIMDDISFQNLECLTIDKFKQNRSDPKPHSISAPNLEYLKIIGDSDYPLELKFKDMCKVNKAIISSGGYVSGSDFMSSLSSIVDLELCFFAQLGEMLREVPHCISFYRLKILTLINTCVLCQFGPISSFLARCPNLEKFILTQNLNCEHFHGDVMEKILEKAEMFCCEHLKLVDIKCKLYYDFRRVEELIYHLTEGIKGVKVVINL